MQRGEAGGEENKTGEKHFSKERRKRPKFLTSNSSKEKRKGVVSRERDDKRDSKKAKQPGTKRGSFAPKDHADGEWCSKEKGLSGLWE